MNGFVDPRERPLPRTLSHPSRLATAPEDLEDLHRCCREGKLYEVEEWLRAGRPVQLVGEVAGRQRRRWTSALEIAIHAGNYALVLLLLANGYDPNRDPTCPLDIALRAGRWDLLDLLLERGANPHNVDAEDLFGTYNTQIIERFYGLGVDLTVNHALARTLADHTSNRPAFGFAKRHRVRDAKVQRDLNMALSHHAERGHEKGLQLCLWAGADPHAPAKTLQWGDSDEEEDEDAFPGFSAVREACLRGDARLLSLLKPDPSVDDFEDLYHAASSRSVIEHLAQIALPRRVGPLIQRHLWWSASGFTMWGSGDTLRALFDIGLRWKEATKDEVAAMRHTLLRTSDRFFIDVMKLLSSQDYCAPEILRDVARTPAFRKRLAKVGFMPDLEDRQRRFERVRPTRSGQVLKKLGIEMPKPKPTLPRCIHIGGWHPGGREIRLDRATLFERLWAEPVTKLAEHWGLSGPGLAKACRRMKIPVPPRGYWAKREAGKRVHRPRLPSLPSGEAEEIVVRVPPGATGD